MAKEGFIMTNVDKYKCNFCDREFVRERTLISHMCETKRRHFNKSERYAQIGLEAWKTFYRLTGSDGGKDKTYSDFMKSRYYIAFIKFGKHVLATNMVNQSQFIPFVIKNHIKLDDWCKDSIYEEYTRTVCRREDVYTAMERQVKIMTDWADENGEEWFDYFKKIPPGTAYKMITSGRLSPWLLLNSNLVETELFPRLSDEQFVHIADFINFDYWRIKMKNEEEDLAFVTEFIKECEL